MEKMKLKIDYSVYLVTDTGFLQGRDFAACIEAALKGGVTLLQYRDKNADSRVLLERALLLKKMCAVYHVPLLINDRLDIALAVQADGVHVGQSDLPVTVVRRLLGEQAVIGASAHNPEWWNDYRAESEKTLPRGTTLDIEFKRSGENEELHTSLFPGTREGRAINLSRVGGKSSELKTFKITRITPNKDSKYNYTIRNSN